MFVSTMSILVASNVAFGVMYILLLFLIFLNLSIIFMCKKMLPELKSTCYEAYEYNKSNFSYFTQNIGIGWLLLLAAYVVIIPVLPIKIACALFVYTKVRANMALNEL